MRGTVSDGVLFTGEKYPKAARGKQAQIGFYKPYAPVSPWYPLSGTRLAAVVSNYPPNLIVVTMPVRLVRAVTAAPEQRYPPRLATLCNSSAISMPHEVFALCFSRCPNNLAA